METAVTGMFLVIVGLVFFITATPAILAATDTTNNTLFGSESQVSKSLFNVIHQLIPIIPILMVFLGFYLVGKGLAG